MRLINRDELNEQLAETLDRMKSKGIEPTWDNAMYVIDMIDDVDAVKVIRCNDCKYFTEYCRIVDGVASNHVCSRKREIDETMHRVKADDYCSWAERKEE